MGKGKSKPITWEDAEGLQKAMSASYDQPLTKVESIIDRANEAMDVAARQLGLERRAPAEAEAHPLSAKPNKEL